jgi:S-formylglutathione hydrolase FrmB
MTSFSSSSSMLFSGRSWRLIVPFYLLFHAVIISSTIIVTTEAADSPARLSFEIFPPDQIPPGATNGRLFVILSRSSSIQPRLTLGRTGMQRPQALARDVAAFSPGQPVTVGAKDFSFPATNLSQIPPGEYFVQALFDYNPDLRFANAPENLYSKVQKAGIDPAKDIAIKLALTEQIPPEKTPKETQFLKFVKLESKLLSKFYGRPIFLRAGIVLPKDFDKNQSQHYPLWVQIGGLNTRYTAVTTMIGTPSSFRETWLAEGTPRFILVHLDGAGPLGDPYYVDSQNNGPFGEALTKELIPYIEAHYRGVSPGKRVLSGVSTGGWVSLALQVFYPDYFSGAWSSCPDPVDFRALQLINLYDEENAFVEANGRERPSERDLRGKVTLTIREEVRAENLLGRNNCYTTSGEQWGEWTATFSPRGRDGSPIPIWDPTTGRIDREVANYWKRYDLRLYLEQHWAELAPNLRGKLHIASGEADQFYLNEAMHLLDHFLQEKKPSIEAKIVFGPGKGHGWFDLSVADTLKEMQAAVEKP